MVFRHDDNAPLNQMYLFDDGYSFGCTSVTSETVRFNASLLLSVDGEAFQLGAGARQGAFAAAVVKPMLSRHLSAERLRLVSIGISPNHPDFRPFGLLGPPGLRGLDATLFAPVADGLAAMHGGTLQPRDAREVYQAVVRIAAAQLPVPRPVDRRVATVMRRLGDDPDVPVEVLAAAVGLSYDRLSHLFSDNLGLSIRTYSLSLRIHAASRMNRSGRTLTEIAHQAGFTDSSHFSRVYQRAYGGSPSYFFGSKRVNVQTLYDAPRPVGRAPG